MGNMRMEYYSKADRRVIICLMAVVMIFLCAIIAASFLPRKECAKMQLSSDEIDSFLTSLHTDTAWMHKEHFNYTKYDKSKYQKEEIPLYLHSFDPNTADSTELLQLGFSRFVVHNILSYRRKNGVFRNSEKLSAVYGMTKEMFKRAEPYITISQQVASVRHDTALHKPIYTPAQKLPEGSTVDINTADTALLKQIPGIGSSYARAIIRYREQLGGYVSVEQLSEIKSLPTDLRKWFCVKNAAAYRQININKCGIEQLTRHPYINFYMAKEIIEYRRKRGNIKSIQQLSLLEVFKPNDIERIKPYITY